MCFDKESLKRNHQYVTYVCFLTTREYYLNYCLKDFKICAELFILNGSVNRENISFLNQLDNVKHVCLMLPADSLGKRVTGEGF